MIKSAYIHIPFCKEICHYCDFNKYFVARQPVDDYIEMLHKEMQEATKVHSTDHISTIYVGGGTPTALNMEQTEKLLQYIGNVFSVNEDIEYTFEANPNDLSYEKLKLLRDYGVNRLSIGVQSFDEGLLKKVGRTHSNEDVLASIHNARLAGFENVNVDFIYGIPGQTLEQWKTTLEKGFELGVDHFSAYSLIVEPKTVFYIEYSKGKLKLPPQELEATMFEYVMEQMEKHGYTQYEISNFSKKGKQSEHNKTYWNNEYYFGLGAGAHGYINGVRYSNVGPVKQYMDAVEEKGSAVKFSNVVTDKERMEEEMFLGLRKELGVSTKHFEEKFGVPIEEVFLDVLDKNIKNGLLRRDKGHIFLTTKGKLLGNEVFEQFLL